MHHKNHTLTRKAILEVQYVELSVRESRPRQLHIRAIGTVPSPGWRTAELIPFVYVQPPADGIYDFAFTARAPKDDAEVGVSSLKDIKVTHVVSPLTDGLKGVRIHASLNSQLALVEQEGNDATTVCVRGTLTDEGVECQALRAESGKLYTLTGDLGEFGVGNEVYVAGTVAGISICQQGTTINVTWIGRTSPGNQAEAA